MKKDIDHPKVQDIVLAVARDLNELNEPEWNVYLINLKATTITGVLVSSKGYGMHEGGNVKTSVLRHFYEEVKGKSAVKVELIPDGLTGISNEFWVSFYIGSQIYDKKYVFLAESISEENLVEVPVLDRRGVMIR